MLRGLRRARLSRAETMGAHAARVRLALPNRRAAAQAEPPRRRPAEAPPSNGPAAREPIARVCCFLSTVRRHMWQGMACNPTAGRGGASLTPRRPQQGPQEPPPRSRAPRRGGEAPNRASPRSDWPRPCLSFAGDEERDPDPMSAYNRGGTALPHCTAAKMTVARPRPIWLSPADLDGGADAF
jgi:hypothetical protein